MHNKRMQSDFGELALASVADARRYLLFNSTCLSLFNNYNIWMADIRFEWNTVKDSSNQKKHGISFSEAQTVFSDPFARLIADPDHSDEEDRFILLGTSIVSKLLVVCHCVKTDESIRIISARKAEKPERKIYEEFRHA